MLNLNLVMIYSKFEKIGSSLCVVPTHNEVNFINQMNKPLSKFQTKFCLLISGSLCIRRNVGCMIDGGGSDLIE